MKIRNGFVSNSSSSSFVIVSGKGAIEEALSPFSPRAKKFIAQVLNCRDVAEINGQECEVYSQTLYDDTLYECWKYILRWEKEEGKDVEDGWEEDYVGIFDKFLDDLKKTENVFVKRSFD